LIFQLHLKKYLGNLLKLLRLFFIFLLALAVQPVSAVPKLLKNILDTNSLYESIASKKELRVGEIIVLSNHITRKNYAIGGKIIRVALEDPNAGQLSLDANRFEVTGDKEDTKNETRPSFGSVVESKTDERGVVKVYFKALRSGTSDIRVYFINQSTDYAEHQNLMRLSILGFWQKWKLLFLYLSGVLTGLALLALLLRYFSPFVLNLLLPPASQK
jgi:hypothetical protein